MLYIIAIVVAFVFLAMSEDKHKKPIYVDKEYKFSEEQIQYLQSINLISEDEAEKYRNQNK